MEEQGHSYSRRTLICRGSNYALPQTALPHRKLPSAPVAEPIELDGFELPWAVRLLHEVYGSVMSARSGHIDWVAVARRMEAQRKPLVAAAAALSRSNKAAAASAAAAAAAAAEHPGAVSTVPPLESATSLEPATLPPPFTPQSVHRLWRFLAYRSGLNGLALPETAAADVESAGVKGALKNGPSSDADRAASGPLDVAERPEQAERKRSRADLDDPNQDPNEDPNEDPNGGPDPDEARDTKRARLDVQGGRIEAIKAEEGQIDRGHAEPVAMDGFVEMNGPTPPPSPPTPCPPPRTHLSRPPRPRLILPLRDSRCQIPQEEMSQEARLERVLTAWQLRIVQQEGSRERRRVVSSYPRVVSRWPRWTRLLRRAKRGRSAASSLGSRRSIRYEAPPLQHGCVTETCSGQARHC